MRTTSKWMNLGLQAGSLLLAVACGSDGDPNATAFPPADGMAGPAPVAVTDPATGVTTYVNPVTGAVVPAPPAGVTPGAPAAPGAPQVAPVPVPVGPDGKPPAPKPAPIGSEFQCDPATASSHPAPRLVTRLSAWEYKNSVRDIFGVDVTRTADSLADGEPTDREFDNLSSTVTRDHANKFAQMASDTASGADINALTGKYGSCDNFDKGCVDGFIQKLGTKVLRGPVQDIEMTGFQGLFATAQAEEVPFQEAARYFIEALLQAPRFVYRIEQQVGDAAVHALSNYELASRVSYLIWGSTPDDQLLELAASGTLAQPAVLGAQVDRLLADERALEHGLQFFDDWMDLRRTEKPVLVEGTDLDDDLLPEMREETRNLFRHLFANKLPLASMHNLQQTKVSEKLADFYGLQGGNDGTYDLSGIPERGGLLTQGAMGSVGGKDGSTVRRGLYMIDQVLCGNIADPPEGLPIPPEEPATEGLSVRAASEARLADPICGTCHTQFEPLVWGLTRFDAAGNYSEQDKFGTDLPPDGWVMFPGDPMKHTYQDVKGLTDILATNPRVRDCATLKIREFSVRQPVRASEGCGMSKVRTAVEGGNGSYQDIVKALALGENFGKILKEGASQ